MTSGRVAGIASKWRSSDVSEENWGRVESMRIEMWDGRNRYDVEETSYGILVDQEAHITEIGYILMCSENLRKTENTTPTQFWTPPVWEQFSTGEKKSDPSHPSRSCIGKWTANGLPWGTQLEGEQQRTKTVNVEWMGRILCNKGMNTLQPCQQSLSWSIRGPFVMAVKTGALSSVDCDHFSLSEEVECGEWYGYPSSKTTPLTSNT